jgi:hypothetical protein
MVALMARSRSVARPLTKTYLKRGKTRSGETIVHARLYAASFGLDLRGSGPTPEAAVEDARSKVTPKR